MTHVPKPWGFEEIWAHVSGKYAGKFLHVNAGHSLSLQYHERKYETMTLLSGRAWVHFSDDHADPPLALLEGDVVNIPPGLLHRVEAVTDCVICEVSTDDLDDVVRVADAYGREGTVDP